MVAKWYVQLAAIWHWFLQLSPCMFFMFCCFCPFPFCTLLVSTNKMGMVDNTRPKAQALLAFLTKAMLVGLTFKQMCIMFCFIFV